MVQSASKLKAKANLGQIGYIGFQVMLHVSVDCSQLKDVLISGTSWPAFTFLPSNWELQERRWK